MQAARAIETQTWAVNLYGGNAVHVRSELDIEQDTENKCSSAEWSAMC